MRHGRSKGGLKCRPKLLSQAAGPADRWFGLGVNASTMADKPWTLVVDGEGAITERVLGVHEAGTLLPRSVTLQVSTRILGGRTAPFPPFLIPNRVPRGLTLKPRTVRWRVGALARGVDPAPLAGLRGAPTLRRPHGALAARGDRGAAGAGRCAEECIPL